MSSNLIDINSVSEWNKSLRAATAEGRTVIVDFWADWCGPCKVISPIFSKLAETFPQVNFLRVNVDTQQPIAAKYQITTIPNFLVFKSGKHIDTIRGADARGLQALINKHAGPNPPVPPLPEKAEEAKLAGNDYFKKGKFAEAVEMYSTAISIVPTSATLFSNRSISFLKSTPPNITAAVDDARHATVLDPKWGKGWVRLGDALLANKAPTDEVKASYEKGLEMIQDGSMRNETEEKLKSLTAPVSAAM